jgi:hypothetical protein
MELAFNYPTLCGHPIRVDAVVIPGVNNPEHFVVQYLFVDGVDISDSDRDEDMDLSDNIVYSELMMKAFREARHAQ